MSAISLGSLGGLFARTSRSEDRAADAAKAVSRADTPARIMVPRLVFAGASVALVLFGLLMIYSSSSIVGLTSKAYNHDPAYFLVRQAAFAGVGALIAVGLARLDYHVWRGTLLKAAWGVTVLSLVLVYTPAAGHDAYGATRWIALGPFSLQPSEFAKVVILLVGARIAEEYYGAASLDTLEAAKLAVVGVVVPLALILWQPDKGTCGVLLLTLLVMCYLSGVSGRVIAVVAVVGLAAAMAYALKDDYSRARILTMLDPFRDEFGSGYQLTQGFYALGSGGVGGVGLGMSRQKYNYLPMAYNDFIFAIIGEELGLLGTVGLLAAFAVLLWAGLRVAQNAPDLTGRLIAAGCTSLLVIQLLLNVSGVVGLFPLSGKPVPFVSYGGSSIISCLMLVGLVMSVSLRSTLPETSHDRRRAQLRLAGDKPALALVTDGPLWPETDGSQASTPTPRSERRVSRAQLAPRSSRVRAVSPSDPASPSGRVRAVSPSDPAAPSGPVRQAAPSGRVRVAGPSGWVRGASSLRPGAPKGTVPNGAPLGAPLGTVPFGAPGAPGAPGAARSAPAAAHGAPAAAPGTPAPARSSALVQRGDLRVIEGGVTSAPRGRIVTDSQGRRRIDLGPSAAERLRGTRSR